MIKERAERKSCKEENTIRSTQAKYELHSSSKQTVNNYVHFLKKSTYHEISWITDDRFGHSQIYNNEQSALLATSISAIQDVDIFWMESRIWSKTVM